MEDQQRSERKSTIDKSDRLKELELQRQAAKFKKKKAEIQQIEVETSLTKYKVDSVEGGIDTNPSVELLSIEHFHASMYANVYKARLKELRKAFAKVDCRIKLFGPENVTLLDKDTYKDYLEETRKLLIKAQAAALDLRSKLDITSVDDDWRIREINQLENKAMQDCMNNFRDVKNKMVELKANVPGIDVGASPATDREAVKEAQHRHPWHNIDLKLKDCQDRTDQEVSENLLNSKDCEKQLDDLTIRKEAIEQDSIGVYVN